MLRVAGGAGLCLVVLGVLYRALTQVITGITVLYRGLTQVITVITVLQSNSLFGGMIQVNY